MSRCHNCKTISEELPSKLESCQTTDHDAQLCRDCGRLTIAFRQVETCRDVVQELRDGDDMFPDWASRRYARKTTARYESQSGMMPNGPQQNSMASPTKSGECSILTTWRNTGAFSGNASRRVCTTLRCILPSGRPTFACRPDARLPKWKARMTPTISIWRFCGTTFRRGQSGCA